MVKIKICGITRIDDALAALDHGVCILGFNFYTKSPRYIPWEIYLKLRHHLENYDHSKIIYAGVFVNPKDSEMNQAITELGLDYIQLHGDEPPEWLKKFANSGVHIYKAIRPQSQTEAISKGFRYATKSSPALLVDAHHVTLYGGTGMTANWHISRVLAEKYPILLAGGLNPQNVSEAIHQVLPWGVDTASGVELQPGIKDHQKIKEFVTAVQQVSQEIHDEK